MRVSGKGELLHIPEAARRLGMKPSTIRAWVLKRRIAYCKPGGRAVRIPAEEVERLIVDGYVPAREAQQAHGGAE